MEGEICSIDNNWNELRVWDKICYAQPWGKMSINMYGCIIIGKVWKVSMKVREITSWEEFTIKGGSRTLKMC